MMTFLVGFVVFLLYVKLAEEIKGYNGVDVHDNCQQHNRQHQLLAVVRYRLQDRS